MSDEIWKDIEGYEGIYQISSHGRVRNIKFNRILKSPLGGRGYPQLCLSKNNVRKYFSIHRLVAQAFIGSCPDGCEVNHINEIKTDNYPENLEYITPVENKQYSHQSGLYSKNRVRGERHGRSKLHRNEVLLMRHIYESMDITKTFLGKMFNVSQPTVSLIINRKLWKHI